MKISSKIELIQGDCLEKLKDIPDGSISLIVTSPPYFAGKEYEDECKTPEGYSKYIKFILIVHPIILQPR